MSGRDNYRILATAEDYSTHEFPSTDAGQAAAKEWLKKHGGGHWGWIAGPRSAKAIAAAERKKARAIRGASGITRDPHSSASRHDRNYCRICKGPHVYKHGRP